VPSAESDTWAAGGTYWSGFWAAYPKSGGLWEISPVGYSPDGHRALVYYEFLAGGWIGAEGLALLEYKGQGWHVSANQIMGRA
jgi:hypothetical protein